MSDELKRLCSYITKKLGIQLCKINESQVFEGKCGYVVDEKGNVTGLSLFEQGLPDIKFIEPLKNLKWLDLSRTGISDISILKHLTNLTRLDLSDNTVADISYLGGLEHLTWVNLGNNKISQLPADILQWGIEIKWKNDLSEGMILEDNPLVIPPAKIIKAGKKALEDYLYKIIHGFSTQDENETKIMIEEIKTEEKDKTPHPFATSLNRGENQKRKVFLSHSSKDKEKFVKPVAMELKNREVDYWLDITDVESGENFPEKIADGIKNAYCIVLFISDNFFQSPWAKGELSMSIKRMHSQDPALVLPVLLGEEKLLENFYWLTTIQYIKWEENAGNVADKILRCVSSGKDDGKPMGWPLDRIFEDQYDEGDSRGAWSKMYPGYLQALFAEDKLEGKDTITFSTWISDALIEHRNRCKNDEIKKEIQERINRFHDYLVRHYDPQENRFGLTVTTSTGERKVIFDIRHTAWAIMALSKIDKKNDRIEEIIRNSCAKLGKEIQGMNPAEQWPVTNAALHRILSEKFTANRIFASPEKVRRQRKILEAELINKFNDPHYCWGWFDDNAAKASIDNSLMIMRTLDYDSIIDADLKAQLGKVATHLLEEVIINLEGEKSALPFMKGDKPDLGATVLFLYILKNNLKFDMDNEALRKLMNFINDPVCRMNYADPSFTWYLSSILCLGSVGR